jgi:hypothetical protein
MERSTEYVYMTSIFIACGGELMSKASTIARQLMEGDFGSTTSTHAGAKLI